MERIQKILLVSDQSESAKSAARVAGELAIKFGAQVQVIYVILPVPVLMKMADEANEPYYGAGSLAGLRGMEQAAEKTLARTVKILNEMGIQPRVRQERGHPAAKVCEVALADEVDLIVMGRQAVHKAAALAPESLSDEVSRCAACSVLVVT